MQKFKLMRKFKLYVCEPQSEKIFERKNQLKLTPQFPRF